jgi:hypothetical protein
VMSQAQRFVPPPALRTRLGAMYAEPHRLLGDRECEKGARLWSSGLFHLRCHR